MIARHLLPLLALAGCGSPPAGGMGTGDAPQASAAVAPALERGEPVELTEFPPMFRGRWALGSADCDPANADIAKGLMVVEARRLVFYEARAVPTTITVAGPTRLIVQLRYSGEGQEWTHRADLRLLDEGRVLARDEPEADTGTLRYAKCPA